jgi:hypothetical protein
VRFAGPDVATVGLIELLADAERMQGLPYPPARPSKLSGLEVSLREKPPPERGERGDSVVTVVGRVVAAAEFVEQVCPVGRHQ